MSKRTVPQTEMARIELLESRASITDLVHRYAKNIADRRIEDCARLFAEHATFEVRLATPGNRESFRSLTKLLGVDAILGYLTRSGAGGVCPMIHNLLIDVSGDEATSSCVMAATVWADGQVIVGEYEDSYRREGDWRFTSRVYTILRQPA